MIAFSIYSHGSSLGFDAFEIKSTSVHLEIMLDIKQIREKCQEIEGRLSLRGGTIALKQILAEDVKKRELQGQVEELKRKKNSASGKIASLKQNGKDASSEIAVMQEVAGSIKELDKVFKESEEALYKMLLELPNIPHDSVPTGKTAEENRLVKEWGVIPTFSFDVKSHVEIGQQLDILDFKRGAKIAGARFVLGKGLGALLERALTNFMLDIHTREHGYQEVLPPFLVNQDTMTGTGQLPKFKEDLFYLAEDHYYLIPTAEVPVTNIYKDEILSAGDLPLYITAHTPCFRREAGSYGKETTGLIRQHQFNKVELVKFTEPEHSYAELEKLLSNAEKILQRLSLPYRVVELCIGDLGFSAAKTYDIEVWLPGQGEYREISSCSNFEDFQARRARIRYKKNAQSKPEFLHTVNGSGVALGRLIVAILENGQREDGSVLLPEVLHPYMNGINKIVKA